MESLLILHLMDRFKQPEDVILSWDASLLRRLHAESIERARIERERGDE